MKAKNFHLIENNLVHKLFWGRVKINFATSFYYFNKGSRVQNLLHQLKYKGYKDVGQTVGRLFSTSLRESPYLQDLNIIIPVPLHPRKQKKRGYNQCDSLAEGLSDGLEIPWSNKILQRKVFNPTQTKRRRYERWENVSGIFEVEDRGALQNKHVLLVDDLITTGSTMEACIEAVQKVESVKVSVASMACALNI